MPGAFTWLLVYQLIGEVIVHFAALPVPGPVVGMLLPFVTLLARGVDCQPARSPRRATIAALQPSPTPIALASMSNSSKLR